MSTGDVVRPVSPDWRTTTRIGAFCDLVEERHGVRVETYADLWRWSVEELGDFWRAVWDLGGVVSEADPGPALAEERMPGAVWFPGARINYARQALEHDDVDPDRPAVIGYSQSRGRVELSWSVLRDQVARCRAGLVRLGVGRGDRVAAYLPSAPETVVAYLATVSLGAVWASCAPELGPRSVVDRLGQIDPKVLLVVGAYCYGDKFVDRRSEVAEVRAAMPSLRHVVEVPYVDGADPLDDVVAWGDLLVDPAEPAYEPVPFDHPLCVLFSSGTTGKPKAIVHGHGGLVLEHVKNHALSWDLGPGDTLAWFSTTTWMVWNSLVSGLLVGTTVVLIDGNPLHPADLQWRVVAETRATMVGLSPAFLMAARRADAEPARERDLSSLRQVGSAGSPLPAEGFWWVRDQLGPDVLLNVGSGGTDVCGGIVQGSPLQPVVAGAISGPCLGVAAQAFDEAGRPVVGELGELVITRPMPSMPVALWGDADGSRYRETYFDTYPGVWRHGDWVRFADDGTCVVAGRSDATLNRGGVRLGTSEFYDVLLGLPEVDEALVVHLEDDAGGNGELVVFLALAGGRELDDDLADRVRRELRTALSPRHVPDTVLAVPAVPVNRTGKRLEVPVKRLLRGSPLSSVTAQDTVADPAVWSPFVALAEARAAGGAS